MTRTQISCVPPSGMKASAKVSASVFLDRVDEALKVIERNPEAPQQILPNLRHVQLQEFKPYSLWYTVGNEILVLACMHGKRQLGPVVYSRLKGLEP